MKFPIFLKYQKDYIRLDSKDDLVRCSLGTTPTRPLEISAENNAAAIVDFYYKRGAVITEAEFNEATDKAIEEANIYFRKNKSFLEGNDPGDEQQK